MVHDQRLPDPGDFRLSRDLLGPDQTRKLGAAVAGLLRGGEIILLYGPLGAGKTCFCQGLCEALGVVDEVVSPTFTLVNTYDGAPFVVHHLDFYRVEPGQDLDDIGLPDILDEVLDGRAVLLIEWPEPALAAMAPDDRRFEFLALPGKGPEERRWHLRGVPDLPEDWTRLFPESSESGD